MPAQLQLPPPPVSTLSAAWRFAAPTALPSPTHGTTDASAGRHSVLERRARLTGRLAKLAATGHLAPLARQISTLGGCARPVRLTGHRTHVHSVTGQVFDHLDSRHLPAGELLVRCGNRRATRCPACSTVYRYDTYQLIAAGLRGGETVPTSVAAHPRVFATLTAPGFGPVHNQPDTGRCHCSARHADDDPILGTPLDPERYDYTGAVLCHRLRPRPTPPPTRRHRPPRPRPPRSRRNRQPARRRQRTATLRSPRPLTLPSTTAVTSPRSPARLCLAGLQICVCR